MTLSMLGITTVPLKTRPEDGFLPMVDDCAALITPKTRAIALVTPNNPTGAIYPPSLISAFSILARTRGIALIIDETYRDFLIPPRPSHPLFSSTNEHNWRSYLIHLYSFSKSYAVPGHRLGLVVASPTFQSAFGKVLDTMQICAPRPIQLALAPLLDSGELREGIRATAEAIHARHAFFRLNVPRGENLKRSLLPTLISMSRLRSTPPELLDLIAAEADDRSLLVLARANHTLYEICKRHIYRVIALRTLGEVVGCFKSLAKVSGCARAVRKLYFHPLSSRAQHTLLSAFPRLVNRALGAAIHLQSLHIPHGGRLAELVCTSNLTFPHLDVFDVGNHASLLRFVFRHRALALSSLRIGELSLWNGPRLRLPPVHTLRSLTAPWHIVMLLPPDSLPVLSHVSIDWHPQYSEGDTCSMTLLALQKAAGVISSLENAVGILDAGLLPAMAAHTWYIQKLALRLSDVYEQREDAHEEFYESIDDCLPNFPYLEQLFIIPDPVNPENEEDSFEERTDDFIMEWRMLHSYGAQVPTLRTCRLSDDWDAIHWERTPLVVRSPPETLAEAVTGRATNRLEGHPTREIRGQHVWFPGNVLSLGSRFSYAQAKAETQHVAWWCSQLALLSNPKLKEVYCLYDDPLWIRERGAYSAAWKMFLAEAQARGLSWMESLDKGVEIAAEGEIEKFRREQMEATNAAAAAS
ncbi:Aminotransferase class I and II [Mycena chlorophos]|uniref:Aminotransferase class I and II n=1 Tax=Mycena chlorophos TaxID=658473 RepID=A0A8H6TKQ9_MYCCL|nr:Aminotransferase class I and II [Mycena chlorophos]